MLSNNQCERSRAFRGLALLSKDHVMRAEANNHHAGNSTMAESTFIVPTTEVSMSLRFKLLLNHPLSLYGIRFPANALHVTKPNIHTKAHNH